MTKTFIDLIGLSSTATLLQAYRYARALKLEGEQIGPVNRLDLLVRLREGAGVVVLTGPEGASYWSLVSREVKVRVVPDGYEYKDRMETPEGWAYRAVGLNSADAKRLLSRKTKLPVGHRLYSHWFAAQGLLRSLEACGRVQPLIAEDFTAGSYTVATGVSELQRRGLVLSLDWEWDIESGDPVGLAIGNGVQAGYVPVRASDFSADTDNAQRDSVSSGDRLKAVWRDYLLSGERSIMHGGRADLETQYPADPLELVGKVELDDTMVMAYLCGEPVLALKELTRKYLGRDPVDFPGNLSDLPVALGTRYAAADARNTYDLYSVLGRTLADREQWGVYTDIERPIIPIIASMEREGVPLDIAEVKRQYRGTVAVEQGIRYAILDNYGFDVAKDYDKAVGGNQARQFVTKVRGSDPGTLDQRVLTTFPEGEVDLLLLHRRSRTKRRNFLGRALRYMYAATHPGHERQLFKARSRFTAKGELTDLGKFLEWKQKWLRLGNPQEFRYFPRFNQAGAMDGENRAAPRSGRLSSSGDINFTQAPRGDYRKVFVPPRGHKWWGFDYSGLELHIAADRSGDKMMLEILGDECLSPPCQHKPKCGDIHGRLQYKVLELTGTLMDRADVIKPFNFEQLYGGGAAKGVEIVAKGRRYITVKTAQDIIDAHHALFAGFWAWREKRMAVNRTRGYAETMDGRRRYIPEYRSRDPERQAYADRAGINHEIQGTAADIVKRVMLQIVPILRYYGAHLCAQVHDEIDGWIPETANLEGFQRDIIAVMTGIQLPSGLRLKVEGGFGNNWGEVH